MVYHKVPLYALSVEILKVHFFPLTTDDRQVPAEGISIGPSFGCGPEHGSRWIAHNLKRNNPKAEILAQHWSGQQSDLALPAVPEVSLTTKDDGLLCSGQLDLDLAEEIRLEMSQFFQISSKNPLIQRDFHTTFQCLSLKTFVSGPLTTLLFSHSRRGERD